MRGLICFEVVFIGFYRVFLSLFVVFIVLIVVFIGFLIGFLGGFYSGFYRVSGFCELSVILLFWGFFKCL